MTLSEKLKEAEDRTKQFARGKNVEFPNVPKPPELKIKSLEYTLANASKILTEKQFREYKNEKIRRRATRRN